MSRQPRTTTFECGVCATDVEATPVLIDASPVCRDCVKNTIVPMFHEALVKEGKYPVRWGGGIVLRPEDFRDLIEDFPAFETRWNAKVREYDTPGKSRVYCKSCSTFLGTRDDRAAVANESCPKCGINVDGQGHSRSSSLDQDPLKDFADSKRCPQCSTPFWLYDGCNTVVCSACWTRFCWLCFDIEPPRAHYEKGSKCPKWNTPEANGTWLDPLKPDPWYAARRDEEPDDQIARPQFTLLEIVFIVLSVFLLYWRIGALLVRAGGWLVELEAAKPFLSAFRRLQVALLNGLDGLDRLDG